MASETLVISVGAAAARAARLDADCEVGALAIYPYTSTSSSAPASGDIFAARVKSAAPEFGGAFVDLGGVEAFCTDDSAVGEGAALLVQTIRPAHRDKLARVTAKISLSGLYAAYLPGESGVGVARGVPDAARTRLQALGESVQKKLPSGRIMWRSAAVDAPDVALIGQAEALASRWRSFEADFASSAAPRQLSQTQSPLARAIVDNLTRNVRRILIDRPAALAQARRILEDFAPGASTLIDLAADKPEFDIDFHDTVDRILSPYVAVAGGGSLAIERTEMGWTIDVDAGDAAARAGGGRSKAASAASVNMSAARAIPRLLTLRGAGGLVIVDFINTPIKQFKALKSVFTEATRQDPELGRPVFDDKLCLAHLTRRGRATPLIDQLTEPLGAPHIGGRRLAPLACAMNAVAALEAALKADRGGRLLLTVAHDVQSVIDDNPQWRADLDAQFGGRFEITGNAKLGREDYDVTTT